MTAISVSHNAHRKLRAPLDKLFVRNSIMQIESRIIAHIDRLYYRLSTYRGTGQVVNLSNAISSLTTDIISSVTFEEPSDFLSDANFNADWYQTLKRGTFAMPVFKHMPWIIRLVGQPLIRYLVARATQWTVWDEKARRQIMLIRKRPGDRNGTRDGTTVLDHLVHSDLVEKELGNGGFGRLAQLIQQAGSYNVSHSLVTIITYLLLDRAKLGKLRKELRGIWTNNSETEYQPSWAELEAAPYLSACIAEGLRLAIGGMARSSRVFPDDSIQLCGWTVPKNTPISMSSYWMQMDPLVFPKPEAFEPSRWMDVGREQLAVMRAHFVPFAKGSRNCVAQNLVYMQMYQTLARLFRPGAPELTLHDTTLQDVMAVHGLLFPMPPLDSNGVRVTIS